MKRSFGGEEAGSEVLAVRVGGLDSSGSRRVDGGTQTPEHLGGRSNGTRTK